MEIWENLPIEILLDIAQYLSLSDIGRCRQVCSQWYNALSHKSIWRKLLLKDFNVVKCGKQSPIDEYRKLFYESPVIKSEVLTQPTSEVMHVAFSNSGKMFSSCLRDGFVTLWEISNDAGSKAFRPFPRFSKYMRQNLWMYALYSQFNEDDSLMLVAGTFRDLRNQHVMGEIVILSVAKFDVIHSCNNKPFDALGTWFTRNTFLTAYITEASYFDLTSKIYLYSTSNKCVKQEVFTFQGVKGKCVRKLLVAHQRDAKIITFTVGSSNSFSSLVGFKRIIAKGQKPTNTGDKFIEFKGKIESTFLDAAHERLFVVYNEFLQDNIENPLELRNTSLDISINVVDLMSFNVSSVFRCTSLCTPRIFTHGNDDFFFSSANKDFVAIASDDSNCYLFNKDISLASVLSHRSSKVNCASLCQADSEILLTGNSDSTIIVWRSRRIMRQLTVANNKEDF